VPLWLTLAIALNWLGCGEPPTGPPAKSGAAAGGVPVDVVVVAPAREDIVREVVLPASVEAFETTTLYSKVSGYLGRIEVDIGDRVGRGQLVAKIEVPEIVDQLREAEADQAAQQADYGSLTLP
jgi:multidrug efflux pump subunit AcrA (membrane-fusion protein)